MRNIVFVEGVSGVGKSTTAVKLCHALIDHGFRAAFYLEGEQRSRVLHTEWPRKINCPIIIVDGTKPINEILSKVGLSNG